MTDSKTVEFNYQEFVNDVTNSLVGSTTNLSEKYFYLNCLKFHFQLAPYIPLGQRINK